MKYIYKVSEFNTEVPKKSLRLDNLIQGMHYLESTDEPITTIKFESWEDALEELDNSKCYMKDMGRYILVSVTELIAVKIDSDGEEVEWLSEKFAEGFEEEKRRIQKVL